MCPLSRVKITSTSNGVDLTAKTVINSLLGSEYVTVPELTITLQTSISEPTELSLRVIAITLSPSNTVLKLFSYSIFGNIILIYLDK